MQSIFTLKTQETYDMLNRLRNHAELNTYRLEAGGCELADWKSSDTGNSRLVGLLYIKGENAHLEWRITLETVIRSVKEMSPEEVTTHKAFYFGKLYFGDGQIYSSFEKFDEMENRHEKVHTIAKDIVSLWARGE